jgi:deoxyhypusine synthase
VDTVYEQMVYSEATLAVPLIVAYAFQKGGFRDRKPRRFYELLQAD